MGISLPVNNFLVASVPTGGNTGSKPVPCGEHPSLGIQDKESPFSRALWNFNPGPYVPKK